MWSRRMPKRLIVSTGAELGDILDCGHFADPTVEVKCSSPASTTCSACAERCDRALAACGRSIPPIIDR